MDHEISEAPLLTGIAEWATDPALRFSDAALRQARLSLVDTLACMLAGRRDPLIARAAETLGKAGASGPVGTILPGVQLSASAAAVVNGAAAHVLDYDDYEIPASTHPSAVILPALLAVSDLRAVSLSELLTAYLVGYDVIVCMGRALGGYEHYLAGWHATSTIGPIGAAAATSKLIGLEADQMAMAMSLATSTSAGLKVQFGTNAKPLHAGLAARAGLEAALLAEAGVTANPAAMEGPYGFLARYGRGRPISAVDPLTTGASYNRAACAMETHPVLRKPWPCCGYTHRCIEASLRLALGPGFDVDEIVRGTIRIPEPYFRVAPFLEPDSPAQARFSVLYCVASALTDGTLTPESFEEPAIKRPAVRALMERFEIDAYDTGPDLNDMSPLHPDSVSLRLADGSERSETVADVRGGINNPLSEADIREKFVLCSGSAETAEALLSGTADGRFQFSNQEWAG